jgi:serine/threonine protein kinase
VFLATWNETLVAVKLLLSTEDAAAAAKSGSASLGFPQPALEALQKEAGMMASLRHPNVVLFLGLCTSPPAVVTGGNSRGGGGDDGREPWKAPTIPQRSRHPALAMLPAARERSCALRLVGPFLPPGPAEYCSRGSLLDVLRAGHVSPQAALQLTWVRRLSMALDAAKGMLCLHARAPPIVHRDLKSPNLLVDAAWRVKVGNRSWAGIVGASRLSLPAPHNRQPAYFCFVSSCQQLPAALLPEARVV